MTRWALGALLFVTILYVPGDILGKPTLTRLDTFPFVRKTPYSQHTQGAGSERPLSEPYIVPVWH